MKLIFSLPLLLFFTLNTVLADGIYTQSVKADYDTTYKKVYKALEDNNFYVLEEINIGKNLSGFAKRWGENYNRNKLENIKVMIICNGWYTNQVGNMDTNLLALCPMRVTLIEKGGVTTVLFAKPSTFAKNSKALPTLKKVDAIIVGAIQSALK